MKRNERRETAREVEEEENGVVLGRGDWEEDSRDSHAPIRMKPPPANE